MPNTTALWTHEIWPFVNTMILLAMAAFNIVMMRSLYRILLRIVGICGTRCAKDSVLHELGNMVGKEA